MLIKYSNRHAPGSCRLTETNMEERNRENIRKKGSFFEKYQITDKQGE
jgi:hypothetical protein